VTCSALIRINAACLLMVAAGAAAGGVLTDPTRPYTPNRSTAAQAATGVVVSAVLSSPERRVAIVNGVAVQVGARVGDVRILEILPDGVRYERQGKQFFSRLTSVAAKVRAAHDATPTATATVATAKAESQEVSP
jgi:hypothetical protein